MAEIDDMVIARIMEKKLDDMDPEEIKLVTERHKILLQSVGKERERLFAQFDHANKIREDLRKRYGPDKVIKYLNNLNLNDGSQIPLKHKPKRVRKTELTNTPTDCIEKPQVLLHSRTTTSQTEATEAGRKKIEEVEKKTKLDKLAERRRQSEIEEKVARQNGLDLWGRPSAIVEPSAAPLLQSEPVIAAPPSSGSKPIFV